MIRISIDFPTIEAATEALNLLSGDKVNAAGSQAKQQIHATPPAPVATAIPAGTQPAANLVPLPAREVVDAAVAAIKRGRGRPRKDAPTLVEGIPVLAPQAQLDDRKMPSEPAVPAVATDPLAGLFDSKAATAKMLGTAPVITGGAQAATAVAPGVQGTAAAVATTPVVELVVAQAALEDLFNARGIEVCMALTARYGVTGTKKLLPEQRGAFVDEARKLLSGGNPGDSA